MSTPSHGATRAAKYVAELVRAVENEIDKRDQQLPFTPSQRAVIRADCERRIALLIDAETGLPEVVKALTKARDDLYGHEHEDVYDSTTASQVAVTMEEVSRRAEANVAYIDAALSKVQTP